MSIMIRAQINRFGKHDYGDDWVVNDDDYNSGEDENNTAHLIRIYTAINKLIEIALGNYCPLLTEITKKNSLILHDINNEIFRYQFTANANGMEWLNIYTEAAKIIASCYNTDRIEKKPYTITYRNTASGIDSVYEIPRNFNAVIIGKYQNAVSSCHIPLRDPRDISVSRIQLIIIPLQKHRRYALVDVGSACGFSIIGVNEYKIRPHVKKTFSDANVLLTGFNATTTIKVSDDIIIIHPEDDSDILHSPTPVRHPKSPLTEADFIII